MAIRTAIINTAWLTSVIVTGRKQVQILPATPGHWRGEEPILTNSCKSQKKRWYCTENKLPNSIMDKRRYKKKRKDDNWIWKQREGEKVTKEQTSCLVKRPKFEWVLWYCHTLWWWKIWVHLVWTFFMFHVSKLYLREESTIASTTAIRKGQVCPSSNKWWRVWVRGAHKWT